MTFSKLGRGINQETEQEEDVTVGDIERRGGLYVLGTAGTGKSTLEINLMLKDIAHGHGLCCLDPHGDTIREVFKRLPAHRKDDVIYFDPFDETHAVGLNLFQCDPHNKKQVSRTLEYVLHIFGKLFTESGDLKKEAITMYETLLNTTILLIYNQGYTLAEVQLLLDEEDAAAKLIPNIPDTHDDVRRWWLRLHKNQQAKDAITKSTITRLQAFLTDEYSRHIVGQSTSTLDFQEITDKKKILLVKLSLQNEELTKLLGSMIIGLLLTTGYARDTREDTEEDRQHFCIYADEFQNFATPDFAKLFTETRKFHFAPTVAHQERKGQFNQDEINLGATSGAANLVLFGTTLKDAQEYAPAFAKKPTSTETRTDTVYTINRNPLDWFRQGKGHKNPRVNELVEKYLQPLLDLERKYKDEYKQQVFPWYAQLNTINTFLKLAMEGHQLNSSNQLKDALGSLIQEMMGGKKGFVTGFSQLYQGIVSPPVDLGYHPLVKTPDFNTLVQAYQGNGQFPVKAKEALIKELFDYHLLWLFQAAKATFSIHLKIAELQRKEQAGQLTKQERSLMLWFVHRPEITQYPVTARELLQEQVFHAQFDYLADRGFQEQQQSEAKRQAIIDSIKQHAYGRAVRIDEKLLEPAPPSRTLSYYQEREHKHHEKLFLEGLQDTDPIMDKRKEKAQELANDTLRPVYQIISEWDELATLLAVDPIMAQSGQIEEKPVPRTEQDMWNEMARELHDLPPRTAYCRIRKEIAGNQKILKYKLYPDPLSAVSDAQLLVAAVQRKEIEERTRNLYCRERTIVQQEITARRDYLKERVQKQAKARTGDEGKLSPAQLEKLKNVQGD